MGFSKYPNDIDSIQDSLGGWMVAYLVKTDTYSLNLVHLVQRYKKKFLNFKVCCSNKTQCMSVQNSGCGFFIYSIKGSP